MGGDVDKVIVVSSLIGTLVIGVAWFDAFLDMSRMVEALTQLERDRSAAVIMERRKEAALQAALSELTKARNNLQEARDDMGHPSPDSCDR